MTKVCGMIVTGCCLRGPARPAEHARRAAVEGGIHAQEIHAGRGTARVSAAARGVQPGQSPVERVPAGGRRRRRRPRAVPQADQERARLALENIAPGSKAKGVETRFTGLLVDTLNLRSGFDRVVILEEDQAKDLMTRAGEELGSRRSEGPRRRRPHRHQARPALGHECILIGRLEDYDEDKVDKSTVSVVSASFNLLDAREKAYTTIDSFTAVKRVWRINIKQTSQRRRSRRARGSTTPRAFCWRRPWTGSPSTSGRGRSPRAGPGEAGRRADGCRREELRRGEFDKATAS